MTPLHSHQQNDLLDEVIDGIHDADIAPSEKDRLLRSIQREGGIVTHELREEIAALFDEQARMERKTADVQAALLSKLEREKEAPTDENNAELRMIATEIMQQQNDIHSNTQNAALRMKEDVTRMERDVSQADEGQKRAHEQEEIDLLRKNLLG